MARVLRREIGMHVGFLSSWDERCGIAEYSRLLVEALRARPEIESLAVVPATFRPSPAAVYAAMGHALGQGEVAHVQHSYAFFGGMHPLRSGWSALANAVSRPLVVTVHELDLRPTGGHGLPAPIEGLYKRWFNRRVFTHPRIGAWMVHAAALRDGLLSLGVPESRLHYRPMPLPPAPAVPPETASLRQQLGLQGKRPLVIVGFLNRRKGYDLALEALRHLPPEYVLVAAGGEHGADATGTEAWLRGEATRLGVAGRLVVTGFLPAAELDRVTALAEAVLAPFREMAASASLGYTLSRGQAVIASDLPENRTLDCVRLFPAGDAAALADAVREVTANPITRERLVHAAREYATRNSYPALAEATVHIYRSLLGMAHG